MSFVGVAWTGDESSFQGFIDRHGLTFPTISDDSGAVFDRFSIPIQPAVVIVQADGTFDTSLGAIEEDDLDALLDEAVGD